MIYWAQNVLSLALNLVMQAVFSSQNEVNLWAKLYEATNNASGIVGPYLPQESVHVVLGRKVLYPRPPSCESQWSQSHPARMKDESGHCLFKPGDRRRDSPASRDPVDYKVTWRWLLATYSISLSFESWIVFGFFDIPNCRTLSSYPLTGEGLW